MSVWARRALGAEAGSGEAGTDKRYWVLAWWTVIPDGWMFASSSRARLWL